MVELSIILMDIQNTEEHRLKILVLNEQFVLEVKILQKNFAFTLSSNNCYTGVGDGIKCQEEKLIISRKSPSSSHRKPSAVTMLQFEMKRNFMIRREAKFANYKLS